MSSGSDKEAIIDLVGNGGVGDKLESDSELPLTNSNSKTVTTKQNTPATQGLKLGRVHHRSEDSMGFQHQSVSLPQNQRTEMPISLKGGSRTRKPYKLHRSFPHSHLIHFSWQTFMGGRKEAEDHVSNRRPKRGKGSLEQESG